MMKCPLKFSRYEFEGGEDCIGAECGFYGCVCTDGSPLAESLYTARQRLSETQERLWEIAAERDDWKAKAEQAESKSAKRAEVLERVKKLRGSNCGGCDILNAMLGEMDNDGTWRIDSDIDKLIYLLTDDDTHSTTGNMTEQPESLSDEADSREKINALRAYYGAGPTAMTDEQIEAGREVYGAKKDADMVIVDELRIDEPDTIRNEQIDNGQLAPEPDSREKLEADVRFIAAINEDDEEGRRLFENMVVNLLDRQAAITERKHLELACAFQLESDKRITELQAKVGELTEQLEAAHAKNRALKLHISKMQNGRHGWHVKGVELQRQVDELTAQLHASNAERARLRECLGIATDNAHDLLTLVDESGNVYERDEGLA